MHLPVQTLETLAARNEFGLGNVHLWHLFIPAESAPQTPERPTIPLW
jgi:hypothetical protein